jgi:uncharacterized protein
VSSELMTERVISINPRSLHESAGLRDVPSDDQELASAPIPADWILEGEPIARNKCVASSTDGCASTYIWECTAGRFNWFYGVDETVYLLRGSITVTDGVETHVLRAGDTFFFPSGSQYQWTVDKYVRKVAFMHVPRSRKLRIALRVFRLLRSPWRMFRRNRGQNLTGLAAVSTRQD